MNDIFDPKLENKPIKEISPKVKKNLIYLACVLMGIAIAVGGILLFNYIFAGASTPQSAVAEYQRASLIYDVDGMIEYSSEYNKIVLNGNQKTSDRLLRAYLNKAYEDNSSIYKEENISFKLISVLEYTEGEGRYSEVIEKYCQKAESGKEDIKAIAIVKMTVDNGKSATTREYVAVKQGFRWFFAFALS